MALIEAFYGILEKPSMVGLCLEMMVFLAPLWTAFLVGFTIGWTWKPQWVNFRGDKLSCYVLKFLDSSLPLKLHPLNGEPWIVDDSVNKKPTFQSTAEFENCRSLLNGKQSNVSNLVTRKDFEHLYQLVEMTNGGPTWIPMIDRSTPCMSYQAWRREGSQGSPQYYNRTVFESATPELVRDFFWDDEFRRVWDDMFAYSAIINECPKQGL